MAPQLIALDWGTSNLRASLLDPSGHFLEQRQSAMGVMKVPDGGFGSVLVELCGDWMQAHRIPLIASGMVGSRQGWKEAPYLSCPATLKQAALQLTKVQFDDPVAGKHCVYIAPGLKCIDEHAQTDVMRGEETQIIGAVPDARAQSESRGEHIVQYISQLVSPAQPHSTPHNAPLSLRAG